MNINKIFVGIMVLLAFVVVCGNVINNNDAAYGAETWIKPNASSVYMTDLSATIHVHIKNNKNHVQYFKISQIYTSQLDTPMNWTVDWTDPAASKMVDAVSPQYGGDWGWRINPGETREVSFHITAVDNTSAPLDFIIYNKAALENTFWPLIPDPGVYSTWFQPNEIEILNPDLDLKYWKGTFDFLLISVDSNTVSGIIRAPIVPTDSKLTASSPKATFTDKDLVINGAIASWDVDMAAGGQKWFSYTYEWDPTASSSSSRGTYSSTIPKTEAASGTSVPTEETGVPYGLFVVGGVLAAGGLIYARFIR